MLSKRDPHKVARHGRIIGVDNAKEPVRRSPIDSESFDLVADWSACIVH
jgi:hypothetical protein